MNTELNQAAQEIDQGEISPFKMQEIMDEADVELTKS
jgi:hypothetical protein